MEAICERCSGAIFWHQRFHYVGDITRRVHTDEEDCISHGNRLKEYMVAAHTSDFGAYCILAVLLGALFGGILSVAINNWRK